MPPTIQVPATYDAEADCAALKKAMKGFGTDEAAIINVLAHRNNAQRLDIAAKYKSMYGKDLLDHLKSEISGNFKDLVKAAMTPIPEFIAKELHDAMAGLGTDESTLIEILCSFNNSWIQKVKVIYEKKFRTTLEKDIKGDTSGSFQKLLVALSQGQRDESPHVDMGQVQADAQALIDAGVGQVGTDESTFNRVMATRSYMHLRQLFQTYQAMTGTPFDKAIAAEFSGDTKDALIAIVRVMQDSALFYAKQLYKAMSGMGTKDKTLIRIVVTGCEFEHLDAAKKAYQAKYGKSLADAVANDTSGDYRKMLLALIN